jgi:hypothetical protein
MKLKTILEAETEEKNKEVSREYKKTTRLIIPKNWITQ